MFSLCSICAYTNNSSERRSDSNETTDDNTTIIDDVPREQSGMENGRKTKQESRLLVEAEIR